jgi:ribosomal protein S28E/S33
MNNTEARTILDEHVRQWEQRSYDELSRLIAAKHIETFEQTGASGSVYQIAIQFFWDDSPGGAIRVAGAIDDGGIRAYLPLCSSALVYPKRP